MTDSNNDRLSKMKRRLLETEVLCQCPDLVNQNASDYVTSLIREWFEISDAGEFVQTDSTPLRIQDFKPRDISEIGDHLRREHGYLFKSQTTPGVSNATTVAQPSPNKSEMTLAQKCEFIRANGEKAFLDLPDNPVAAKPLVERPRSTWSVEENADFARRHGLRNTSKFPLINC